MPSPSSVPRGAVPARGERPQRAGDERDRPQVEARQRDRACERRPDRDERAGSDLHAVASGRGSRRPPRCAAAATARQAPMSAENALVKPSYVVAREPRRQDRGERERRVLDLHVAVGQLPVGERRRRSAGRSACRRSGRPARYRRAPSARTTRRARGSPRRRGISARETVRTARSWRRGRTRGCTCRTSSSGRAGSRSRARPRARRGARRRAAAAPTGRRWPRARSTTWSTACTIRRSGRPG